MKKLCSWFLTIVLCIVCIGCTAFAFAEDPYSGTPSSPCATPAPFSEEYEDHWRDYVTSGMYDYYVNSDGTAELYFYGGTGSELTIPLTLQGHKVICIGNYAFKDSSTITSLVIPEGITMIRQNGIYNCRNLTHIEIPDSLTDVGGLPFNGYVDGKPLTLDLVISPKHPTLVVKGNVLFSKPDRRVIQCTAQLPEHYTVPDGTMIIGDEAFRNQRTLTSVTLPNGVTTIGSYAFYECPNLSSINIPDTVTSIGEDAFYYCESLLNISIPASVTSFGSNIFLEDGMTDSGLSVTVTLAPGSAAEQYCIDHYINYKYFD